MVTQSIEQTVNSGLPILVVAMFMFPILATSSDGAIWGVLGLAVGTAGALLGIYAGDQSSNPASV